MMRAARLMSAAGLVISLVPLPAQAAGCEKLVTGAEGGDCQYVATGAGEWRVRTVSGFRVGYWRDGEWTTVAAKVAVPEQPLSGIAVAEGAMPSQPGDIVHLSILVGSYTPPGMDTHRYQNGKIEGRDGSLD